MSLSYEDDNTKKEFESHMINEKEMYSTWPNIESILLYSICT